MITKVMLSQDNCMSGKVHNRRFDSWEAKGIEKKTLQLLQEKVAWREKGRDLKREGRVIKKKRAEEKDVLTGRDNRKAISSPIQKCELPTNPEQIGDRRTTFVLAMVRIMKRTTRSLSKPEEGPALP